jgi:outer membrane protein TolC
MNPPARVAFIIVLCCLLLNKPTAHAQTAGLDSLLVKVLESDTLLPILIDSAIHFSPEARKTRSLQQVAELNNKIGKNTIYDAISMHGSYGYGTNYSAVNNQVIGTGSNLTTAQTSFYNAGIGIQLPLSLLLNRKTQLKVKRAIVETAIADRDNTELLVRQDVINLYQEFKLNQKLLTISSKNKEAAEVNNVLAQKDFLNAQITVDQVSGVMEKYNKAIVDFETNVIKFQTSLLHLETYTGVNLSILIRKLQ